jgi:hypothetical protein
MAESIFNRPMFQNINNAGPDFSKPIVPKFGNTEDPDPSTAVGGKEVPRVDFGNPKYQQPLGMDEIYAKAAAEIDPAKIRSMYTEYAGEPKSFQDFADIYESSEEVEISPQDNMKFEKNLALARLGLNLMKPTIGGQLTPAIAHAGENFLADLAGINEQKRKQKAARREEEKADERAKREWILDALDNQRNTRDAEEYKLFEKALGFNMENIQNTNEYQRELAKNFYSYQYDNDQRALENNAQLLIKGFNQKPVVFAIPGGKSGSPEYRTGYVEYDKQGRPINMLPVVEDGQMTYKPDYELGKQAVKATFQFSDAGVLGDNVKEILATADKVNTAGNALQFIQDIKLTMAKGGAKVGAPGLIKGFAQDVRGTALDIADWLAQTGVIDSEAYNAATARLENSIMNDLGQSYYNDPETQGRTDYATNDPVYNKYFNSNTLIREGYDKDIVQNIVRINSIYYALARKRKPSGRLNVQDIEDAKKSLQLYDFNIPISRVIASLDIVEEELGSMYQNELAKFKYLNGDEALLGTKPQSFMDVEVQKDVETISPYGDTQINTGFSETIPSGSG